MRETRAILQQNFFSIVVLLVVLFQGALASGQSATSLRFTDIDGQSWDGQLVSLDQDVLVYKPAEVAGGLDATKKLEQIVRIERFNKSPNRGSDAWPIKVGLTDGSILAIQKIEGREKDWRIQLDDRMAQVGFAGELKYLKLKSLDAKGEEAWEAYVREEIKSDALIVVRPGGALDRVDGVVKEIRDGKIQFDVDGQIVEASFDRLAGVLWYRKALSAKPKGVNVILSNGSTLFSQKVKLVDDSLQIAGSWGDSLIVPLQWLDAIDCGLDKLAWLSGLMPIDSRSNNKGGFGDFDSMLAKTTKPRWVKGEGSNQDLLFSGPGEYMFRAPEGMTKLQARLQRSSESESRSAILVEVWVDDQIAIRKEIAPEEELLDLEVPIVPEKKIKLVMASKSALNLGTRVLWRQPRLSK
ncbi:MAG: hypothetical protein LW850_23650 [Planctomycetaceae bacterium]|jgi:hypothetical protein|nr:hypothetical protein [Planctomycetaceae bacterium]MCE2813391.1 hypothetical protein [Planctomycetaceae bacterium]